MSEAPEPDDAGIRSPAPPYRIGERWCVGLLAVLLCGLFISWLILSTRLPAAFSSRAIGPARFPELVSGLGVILAVLMLAAAITTSARNRWVEFNKPWATVCFFLLLPLYAVLMNAAGFYVASFISLPLIVLLTGGRSWLMLVSVPVLFGLFIYFCFGMALHVPIP